MPSAAQNKSVVRNLLDQQRPRAIVAPAMLRGALPTALGNAISDAIKAATDKGMDVDEAVCVVVAVAADYARIAYGADYLRDLADVVVKRGDAP